jgi:hypothetical protein
VFYDSLFKEKGESSDLAVVWCIEHGVLPLAVAKSMTSKYLKAKERLRSRTVSSKGGASGARSESAGRKSSGVSKIIQSAAVSDATVGMSTASGDAIGQAAF